MEQTQRDTVIELLCAGHRPAAITKLLKYPKRTVYDISKKWEESGMSDRICTPTFVAGLKRSIRANPGTPMSILPGSVGSTCRRPWIDSVASGTPYTFQQDSAPAHTAKLVLSSLKKNVPNFWDYNTWSPNSPELNPCDYY
ncbi:Transposable element tcb1 transposase, partial [Caligus rogercresseyi]